ncbi:DUF3990 domain-containing protein [Butyrivibrio sp. WCD2001]|uniref:DUF3990 domain-containing protein n=1 Tax=Butyrivibrio sp. WCD2001 TaxID=1280681 RepID=UPI00041D94D6|nr:DUF3990 domain-containing protein [Butyrivibrio sp. WCD2001]
MITLYHSGYVTIEKPDVHFGRKNADFGQGFYTTDDPEFACRWVREKSGSDIIINRYELDESVLKIKTLERNSEWFEYIFANRRVKPDVFADYDLIIGPIANDTIYETFGIITSGFLSEEEAMKLLMVGDFSRQIVLKSEKAAEHLRFVSSEILGKEKIEISRKKYLEDNEKFQAEFAKAMKEFE